MEVATPDGRAVAVTSIGVDGAFAMLIPGPDPYVLNADLAGFAAVTREVTVDETCRAAVEIALILSSLATAARPETAAERAGVLSSFSVPILDPAADAAASARAARASTSPTFCSACRSRRRFSTGLAFSASARERGYGVNCSSPTDASIVRQPACPPPFATTDTWIGRRVWPLSLTDAFTTPPAAQTTNNQRVQLVAIRFGRHGCQLAYLRPGDLDASHAERPGPGPDDVLNRAGAGPPNAGGCSGCAGDRRARARPLHVSRQRDRRRGRNIRVAAPDAVCDEGRPRHRPGAVRTPPRADL